ncbi:Calumenin [Brachionus plicatilis]|uniref:Reticulocalbin-3 n=1 Tax=Brachionus plicatilis TaxID=10195 RepID=A0A3M7PBU2_BRAPC|nr:Calumenin [Brachionus plicatilis]
MKSILIPIKFFLCLGLINCSALNLEDERIHTHQLTEELHYKDTNGDNLFEHNVEYDHEAFLGKAEAEKFRSLTPEESKERLGKIVEKIDVDHDEFINETELYEWLKNVTKIELFKDTEKKWNKLIGKIDRNHDFFITENELRIWIRQQHRLDLQKETDKKWKKVNPKQDQYLKFDELIENTIGGSETWSNEEKENRKELYDSYLKMMERNKKRFKAADFDGDGKLSRTEYSDFLHPEESKTMRQIVIDETIEDLDKNGDGVVSLDVKTFGYLLLQNINFALVDLQKSLREDEAEPEWIQVEIENFKLFRDKNKDNVLDREEVNDWILPSDYDHSLNEAKHLIYEADENKDGKLSKKEILDSYNLFVASQATAYGKAIYEKEDL